MCPKNGGLANRQARLQLKLDQPARDPSELLQRIRDVLTFSASLPQAFIEGDVVRRRQIATAVCANWTVKDRKALYKANEPFSFFEGSGLIRSWCPPEESNLIKIDPSRTICPQQESNLYRRIRNPMFYPLNYGGKWCGISVVPPSEF